MDKTIYKCKMCDFDFSSYQDRKSHYDSCDDCEKYRKSNLSECDKCGDKCENRKKFQYHYSTKHQCNCSSNRLLQNKDDVTIEDDTENLISDKDEITEDSSKKHSLPDINSKLEKKEKIDEKYDNKPLNNTRNKSYSKKNNDTTIAVMNTDGYNIMKNMYKNDIIKELCDVIEKNDKKKIYSLLYNIDESYSNMKHELIYTQMEIKNLKEHWVKKSVIYD